MNIFDPLVEANHINLLALCQLYLSTPVAVVLAQALHEHHLVSGLRLDGSTATKVTGFPVFEGDRARMGWRDSRYENIIGRSQGSGPLETYAIPPIDCVGATRSYAVGVV